MPLEDLKDKAFPIESIHSNEYLECTHCKRTSYASKINSKCSHTTGFQTSCKGTFQIPKR